MTDEEKNKETTRQIQMMIDCLVNFKENKEFIGPQENLATLAESFIRMGAVFSKSLTTLPVYLSACGLMWENAPLMTYTELPLNDEQN